MRLDSEKKRVLMVLPNLDRGGAEMLVTYMLTEGFSDAFHVSLCTLCPSLNYSSERKLRELGVDIYPIGLRRTNLLRIMLRFYRILRELKPHVVHTHLYPIVHCLLPIVLAGIPARVHTVHSMALHEGGLVLRMAVRIASRYFGFVLPGISPSIAETIRAYHSVTDVPIIKNGIPVDRTTESKTMYDRKDIGLTAGDFICIQVASFKHVKNHAMIIESFREALKKKSELVLLLAGEGPLRGSIERMAMEYGISERVRFLGLRDDIMGLHSISDLFLLSSHWEGLPISIMEAMSAGLPVVATDVGGVQDLVEDGRTGIVVKPQDVSAFSNAIVELAEDRDRAHGMGEEGRERIRMDFSIESTVRGHELLYLKLLGADGDLNNE